MSDKSSQNLKKILAMLQKEIMYQNLDFTLYYEYKFTPFAISNCRTKSKHKKFTPAT